MTIEPLPTALPTQGLIAGKYELIRMIGKGGMGSVWEARHISLGTPSAIKFIESEYADSQEARSRFDKEAKAAATIQSKHAIQIYDHGVTDDGKPYIVMELLQGEPLDKRIDRMSRLSLQDTAKIIGQVSRGLARAHERGIIHRDLKPENIFLVRTPDDDDEVAKVLDFGIAKMANSPGSPGITSSTKTGAVLGTPFYMSPEQARGLRNVDHRTDCWSLGVIAFKCITGRLPFDGESVGDLLVKIGTAPLPIPSQVVPGIPPNFDAWFMRAMEREPDRRFSTVTELAEALSFAAGIAPRSMQHPMSGQPTLGTPSGPHGFVGTGQEGPHGFVGTGQEAAHVVSAPPYPYGPGNAMAMTPGPRTPPPGAMTNAPFTSERVAGVPSNSGKLVAGVMVAALAIGGLATGAFLHFRKPPVHAETTNGMVAVPTASLPPVATTTTTPAPVESAPPPVRAPAAETASAQPTAKPAAKATAKPVTTAKTPPALPSTAPAPPPPAPAPTPKKPNKNDRGY